MKYFVTTFQPFDMSLGHIQGRSTGHHTTVEFDTKEQMEAFVKTINDEKQSYASKKREADHWIGGYNFGNPPREITEIIYGKKLKITQEKKNIKETIISHEYTEYKIED